MKASNGDEINGIVKSTSKIEEYRNISMAKLSEAHDWTLLIGVILWSQRFRSCLTPFSFSNVIKSIFPASDSISEIVEAEKSRPVNLFLRSELMNGRLSGAV